VHGGSGVNAYFAQTATVSSPWTGSRLAFVNQCNRTGRQYNEQPFLRRRLRQVRLGYWLEPNIARAIALRPDSLGDVVIGLPAQWRGIRDQPSGEKNADGALIDPPVVEARDLPAVRPRGRGSRGLLPHLARRLRRQLRYQAIDLGADAVLNSHPHVLQGFEVYQGARSSPTALGNFMFDLY